MTLKRMGTPGWMFVVLVSTLVVWGSVVFLARLPTEDSHVKVAVLLVGLLVVFICQNMLALSQTVQDLRKTVARLEEQLRAQGRAP